MFGDFDDFDSMDTPVNEAEKVIIKLGKLEGMTELEVVSGMTVRDFKLENDLDGKKLVSRTRGVLQNDDILDEDEIIFVSTSKDNG